MLSGVSQWLLGRAHRVAQEWTWNGSPGCQTVCSFLWRHSPAGPWLREQHIPAQPAPGPQKARQETDDEGPGLYSTGNGEPQVEFKQKRGIILMCVLERQFVLERRSEENKIRIGETPKAQEFPPITFKLLFLF